MVKISLNDQNEWKGKLKLRDAQAKLSREIFHINPIFMADFVWTFELDEDPSMSQKVRDEVEFLVRKSFEKNRFTRALALVIAFSSSWPSIELLIGDILYSKDKYEISSLICIEKQLPKIHLAVMEAVRESKMQKEYKKWAGQVEDELEKNLGVSPLVLFQDKKKGPKQPGDKEKEKKPKKHVDFGEVVEASQKKPLKDLRETDKGEEHKESPGGRRNPREKREDTPRREKKESNENKKITKAVPAITRKLCKKLAWEKVEEIYSQSPVEKLIGAALFYMQKINEQKNLVALTSLAARHKEILEELRPHLTKEQIDMIEGKKEVQNIIYSNDRFGPLEVENKQDGTSCLKEKKFLTLEELGVSKEQVIFTQYYSPSITKEILAQKTVGIDTESVMFFTMSKDDKKNRKKGLNKLSLIQIALPIKKVYLFDVLALKDQKEFLEMINDLITSETIQKVFFGGRDDLHEMRMELKLEKLVMDAKNIKELSQRKNLGGLKLLVERTLNKHLCKFEQKSAWGTRPLRQSQLHYAALDAVVLLELLNAPKPPIPDRPERKPKRPLRENRGDNERNLHQVWVKKPETTPAEAPEEKKE